MAKKPNVVHFALINIAIIFTLLFSPRGSMLGKELWPDVVDHASNIAYYLNYGVWLLVILATIDIIYHLFLINRISRDLDFAKVLIIMFRFEHGRSIALTGSDHVKFAFGAGMVILAFVSSFYMFALTWALYLGTAAWLRNDLATIESYENSIAA